MRGTLGCLLGFWPLGQDPAGAIKHVIQMLIFHSFPREKPRLLILRMQIYIRWIRKPFSDLSKETQDPFLGSIIYF